MTPEAASNPSSSGGASAVDGSGFQDWKSPVPYLFVGLALMLALIAVSLLLLACSYKTSPSSSTHDHEAQKKSPRKHTMIQMEPEIVVVMAGDHDPTYLAKPVAHTSQTHEL